MKPLLICLQTINRSYNSSKLPAAIAMLAIFVFTVFVTSTMPASASSGYPSSAGQAASPTPTFNSGVVIATVNTGTEPSINVRSGPGIDYLLLGRLLEGEQVRALGRSPGGDWVKVAFASSPDGTGWVYAYLVSLNGTVPIAEPPPTPTPQITPTIDKTRASQFILEPQATRKPTFTPPPPLAVPTFTPPAVTQNPLRPEFIYIILGIGALGLVGVISSFLRQK
jgi:hypothetical protein